MRRSQRLLGLAKVLAIILLLAPISASPLGLGDIRLHSALNQQLEAEIDLLSLGQTRAEEISVNLASRAAFERAGVERPLFLNDLRFEVEPGTGNSANIIISSERPIREPFLDFLVEVNWPGGRLLREYTVLLDPPLFLDESPSVIEAPAVTAAAPAAAPATTRATVPERLSASTRVTTDGGWNYGPVQRSDTLWSIAEEYRGFDDSVTTEQVMMALLRSNPDAFYNNNINELRAGHVLRMDDPSSVGELTHAAAAAEARRQFSQWQDAKREQAQAAAPRPMRGEEQAGVAAPGVAAVTDEGPRLRLTAPDAAEVEQFSMSAAELEQSGMSDAAVVARLREDLTAALEVSESARMENIELRQRLAELEEQIGSMQRLLSLQEDSMAALQAGAGTALETPPAVIEPAQPDSAVAAPQEMAEGASLVDNIAEDPMMLGAAGVALLMVLTLGWLIVRRRQMAGATLDELTDSGNSTVTKAYATTTPAVAAVAATAAATAARPVTTDANAGGTSASDGLGNVVAGGVESDSAEDLDIDLMQADEDDIDILAEADVYLAYRRFDKAEELLKEAVAAEPGRHDLVLKLLEVHAGSGNVDAFVDCAQPLQGGDEALWSKVVVMGKRLAPEHPLFGGEVVAETAAESQPEIDAALPGEDELDGLELDFSTEMDQPDEGLGQAGGGLSLEDVTVDGDDASDDVGTLELDVDEETLARLETGSGELDIDADEAASMPEPVLDNETESVYGFEIPADDQAPEQQMPEQPAPVQPEILDDQVEDNELERQLLAAGGESGSDIDWLSEIGNDLGFEDTDGDDADGEFSGLISGEDEVGTKLDLARAYIDMGDQDSARSILNEVTAEGNEDQQREASDLIRQIG